MELPYDRVELSMPKRSKFDLSFDRKMSFDMGFAYPILCQECVPGDSFHIQASHLIRFQPLVSPVFHNMKFKVHYFFVPNRLVWDNWADFITQKDSDLNTPTTNYSGLRTAGAGGLNNIADYFDIPVQMGDASISNDTPITALPFRAYNLIYNEYFRDEFKQNERTIYKGDTVSIEEMSTYRLFRVGWEKDYFTNAQHHPQQGAAVTIPIKNNDIVRTTIYSRSDNTGGFLQVNAGSDNPVYTPSVSPTSQEFSLKKVSNVNLNNFVTAGTIHELYNATAIQRFRDKLQLGGSRYNETILSLFGVVTPDYRLQRPEYIGGTDDNVQIGRVLQTAQNDTSPLGSYAGEANSAGKSDMFDYYCEEHGYIIGLCYLVPRSGYQQGIPRPLIKRDIYDYYFPDFALLGDQEVLNDEIYMGPASNGTGNGIFGYNPRYSEYKINVDRVNGDMRTSLNFWHMNRIFDALPQLNSEFLECDPTTRIFAVEDSNSNRMYMEVYQDIQAVRPMPTYVLPQIAD